MKVKCEDIADAVKDSDEVELSKDHKKVRRANNAPLPKKEEGLRKREMKGNNKEEFKKSKGDNAEDGKEDSDVELDERGNFVLVNADFENP